MEWLKRNAERLGEKLEKRDMDRFVVAEPSNLSYMTGKPDVSGVLVVERDGWNLMTSKFYRYGFKGVSNTEFYSDRDEKKEMLEGLEGEFSDREEVAGTQFESSNLVEEMRKVKTSREIKKLREAAETGDKAYRNLKQKFEPGMTEWECVKLVDSKLRDENVYNSFDTLVQANTLQPHRTPRDTEIKKGDLVLADLGCRRRNYCSDMTRIIPNSVEGRKLELFEDLLQVQRKAMELVRAGKNISELCLEVEEKVEEKGYKVDDNYLHTLGHGVGVEVHEKPVLSKDSEEELEKGNVVTVEPGIYVPGVGGVRIEDTVIVKKKGCERLTRSGKQI